MIKPSLSLSVACLTLYCANTPVLSQDSTQTQSQRYAVMEFKGTSEFPHANQPIIGGGGFEDDSKMPASDDVSTAKTQYLLILDTEERLLYVFYDMSIWSLSNSKPDAMQSLWQIQADQISNESSEGRELSKELIWSPKTGKLFSEIFQLPVDGPVNDLMAKIDRQCNTPRLGDSEDRLSGGVHRQRLVQSDGNLLVFNETISGQAFVSIRAERLQSTDSVFRCKLIAFMHEKPIETIEGEMTVSKTSEFPPLVAAWREKHRRHSQPSKESGAPAESNIKEVKHSSLGWSRIIAIVGGASLVSVLFGFYFVSRMKRDKK